MKRLVVLGVIASALFAAPALSQQEVVQLRTDSGCIVLDPLGLFAASVRNGARLRWTGQCSDGLISGQGTLYVENTDIQWQSYRNEFQFAADRGLLDGAVRETRYSDMDFGTMQLADDGRGPNPSNDTYEDGCLPGADACFAADGAGARAAFLAARQGGARNASSDGQTNSSACAGDPDATWARVRGEIDREAEAHPVPPQSAGTRAQYQHAYALGEHALGILDRNRGCLGPHYEPNYTRLAAVRDAGKAGCEQTSTNYTCRPEYP